MLRLQNVEHVPLRTYVLNIANTCSSDDSNLGALVHTSVHLVYETRDVVRQSQDKNLVH